MAGPRSAGSALRRAEPAGDALEGSTQRPGAGGLDRVESRPPGDEAGPCGLVEGEGLRGGQRPATDLDDEPVEGHAPLGELVDHLPAQGCAALDDEAVLVALAGERDRTRVDGRSAAGHSLDRRSGRSPGTAPRPCASRSARRARIGVSASGRHEDQQPAPRRAGDDGGSQGGVAAAGDGQGPARVHGLQRLGDAELEHDRHEVPRLVRAGHVARLVLDPDAARSGQADACSQLPAPG